MQKTRLSNGKQARLIEYFVSETTTRTTTALVNMNKSTAAYYFLRLCVIITQALAQEMPLAGAIEVDKNYLAVAEKENEDEERQGGWPSLVS